MTFTQLPQYISGAPKLTKTVLLWLLHHQACWTWRVDLIPSDKIRCPTRLVWQHMKFYQKWTFSTTIATLQVNTCRCGSIKNKILLRLTRIKLFWYNLYPRYNLEVLRGHLICLISVIRLYILRLCVVFYSLLNDQKCLWDTNENKENSLKYS